MILKKHPMRSSIVMNSFPGTLSLHLCAAKDPFLGFDLRDALHESPHDSLSSNCDVVLVPGPLILWWQLFALDKL